MNYILSRFLVRVPRKALHLAVKLHIRRRKQLLAMLRTPSSLILYVTSRCNMKCSHCFYWDSLNKKSDELTVEECHRLASSLQHPIALSITGGEPMLRNDLSELVRSFTDCGKLKELSMASNGYFTAPLVDFCSGFCRLYPQLPLSVQISLDGTEATHDAIRGSVGAFARAMTTVERLKELAAATPLFSVSVGIAVQKGNLGEMGALLDLVGASGAPIRINLIRGESAGTFGVASENSSHVDPRGGSDLALDLDELRLLHRLLLEKNQRYAFWTLRHQRIFEIGMQTVATRQKQIDCYAGTIDAVVYANGDVSLCELTKPVGNLHDYGFDLQKLWADGPTAVMRSKVARCFCTHGCNLSTSLMFEPDIALEVLNSRLDPLRKGAGK